jgi:hypothetical protein
MQVKENDNNGKVIGSWQIPSDTKFAKTVDCFGLPKVGLIFKLVQIILTCV